MHVYMQKYGTSLSLTLSPIIEFLHVKARLFIF